MTSYGQCPSPSQQKPSSICRHSRRKRYVCHACKQSLQSLQAVATIVFPAPYLHLLTLQANIPAVTAHASTERAVTVPAVAHCKGGPASEKLQPLQTETLQALEAVTLPASQQLPAGTAEEQRTAPWTWKKQQGVCTSFEQPAGVIVCATSHMRIRPPHVCLSSACPAAATHTNSHGLSSQHEQLSAYYICLKMKLVRRRYGRFAQSLWC